MRAVSGSERLTAEALAGRGMHEVWVRYRADVAPALRFVAGSRVLDIRAALDLYRAACGLQIAALVVLVTISLMF